MEPARTRYELRVGTLVSRAALGTFRLTERPTAVPRQTVYWFRVPADRDLSDVLDRLIARRVEVLGIRRCPEPPSRPSAAAPTRQEVDEVDDVVVPFRARTAALSHAHPGPRGRRSRRDRSAG
jgi:hypothetical protein